jgi:hypothetical protein
MPEEGRPMRIAAVGWALTILGCLVAVSIATSARVVPNPTTILWAGGTTAALLLTAGLGLIFGRRWAWPLAVVFGLLVLASATRMLARPEDFGPRGGVIIVLSTVPVLLAAAMLGCLLTPRSFRWLWSDGSGLRSPPRTPRP